VRCFALPVVLLCILPPETLVITTAVAVVYASLAIASTGALQSENAMLRGQLESFAKTFNDLEVTIHDRMASATSEMRSEFAQKEAALQASQRELEHAVEAAEAAEASAKAEVRSCGVDNVKPSMINTRALLSWVFRV
jgi:hypothetical protein